MSGYGKACQGRPVDDDALALLAQRVEEAVRARGAAEVPSHEVGLAILGPLRELDEVAYLRFASVYKSFDSLEDFEREIAALQADRALARAGAAPARDDAAAAAGTGGAARLPNAAGVGDRKPGGRHAPGYGGRRAHAVPHDGQSTYAPRTRPERTRPRATGTGNARDRPPTGDSRRYRTKRRWRQA